MANATVRKVKKAKKAKTRSLVRRGKRKRAIARVTIREGKGRITVNRHSLKAFENLFFTAVVSEPFAFVTPEQLAKVDINAIVEGGGVMGQAQAIRTAIAHALVDYFEDDALRANMLNWDRSLLVEDPRRVEPKKFKGPKARARFTKSYR